MSKSLISNEKKCYRCGTTQNLHRHHIYAGGLRKNAEKYGCWCYLCADCHTGKRGVHNTKEGIVYWQWLMRLCQERFEEKYNHETFMKIFRRNFI